MKHPRSLAHLIAGSAAVLLAGAFALTAGVGPASAATNLLANPGFETGLLSGWSCSSIDSVTTSPVHSGTHALQGAVDDLRQYRSDADDRDKRRLG